jgi:pimeloyl-ACP methyl ester carboxylesterase
MTEHYFENDLVNLHYYKFGDGPKTMLCFHGYGMHGKQFKLLESDLGSKYTFYGFDLFFHKETKLKDQSLPTIKKGITKKELANFVEHFCMQEGIGRFSLLSYSMGTHYATTIVEELPSMVDEYIVAAPMCLRPGTLITYFSKSKMGNSILEKVALNKNALTGMLKLFKRLRFINSEDYKILYGEIGTPELRFNLYASFTYLRFLETDEARLSAMLNEQNIKSIFIFGKRDKSFPPGIGSNFIKTLKQAEVIVLDEGHELVKRSFAASLTNLL